MSVTLRKDEVLTEAMSVAPKKVRVIAPRKKFLPKAQQENVKMRVAAYCRVSTDSDEQEVSFASQCLFYRNKITENPNYIFVDVYADEGITGTSTIKREAFMRLMNDCLDGKVDMIITKSITRFARNTLDAIKWIRKLKSIGVDIYFELENLHSLTASEIILTMLSSIAQESSQTKSDSVKWGYERQFEKGKTYLHGLYGYRTDRDAYYIHKEEAEIVQEMFDLYLDGMTERAIADILTQRGVLTRQGNKKWSKGVIQRMLQNIKYSGDSIQGLSFNQDFINQKRQVNKGQRKMYFVENSHKGIISKEKYKAAQVERARRNSKMKVIEFEKSMMQDSNSKNIIRTKCGKYSTRNALSNRIICSECGSYFRRTVRTKRDGSKLPVWRCINKLDNGVAMCPKSPTLKEELLFKEITKVINKILTSKSYLKKDIAKRASEYVNPKDITTRIENINKELKEVDLKINKVLQEGEILISRGVQDEDLLKERLEDLYQTKRKLTDDLESENNKLKDIKQTKETKLWKALQKINTTVTCFTQEEIAAFVEEIVVYEERIEIKMKTGNKKTISMEKVK